jgi:acylphosphatase
MATVHLLIQGKVQGVFYRATAKEIAQSLDLSGWVKNTSDGHVEVVVSGSEKSVQQFIEWSKRGPEKAVVTSVKAIAIEEESFPDFRVIRG